MTAAAIGIAIGATIALAISRFISSLLYHVSATDPFTYIGSAALLAAVALAAIYIPARRAIRVDPILRSALNKTEISHFVVLD